MEPTAMTLASLLTDIGSVITAITTNWMPAFMTFITGQPLVLLGFIIIFTGLAVGMIKRLVG